MIILSTTDWTFQFVARANNQDNDRIVVSISSGPKLYSGSDSIAWRECALSLANHPYVCASDDFPALDMDDVLGHEAMVYEYLERIVLRVNPHWTKVRETLQSLRSQCLRDRSGVEPTTSSPFTDDELERLQALKDRVNGRMKNHWKFLRWCVEQGIITV